MVSDSSTILHVVAPVLILVVMEDGLRHPSLSGRKYPKDVVLILVVMEDGLRLDSNILRAG